MKKRFLFLLLIFTSIFSFNVFAFGEDNNKSKAFDLNSLDRSVSPAQNFYQFAVGNWSKNHPIPDDKTRWASFSILEEQNNKILKEIVEELAANKNLNKGTPQQKIGDFYATGMDSIRIEKAGYNPIKPYLQQIDNLDNKKNLFKLISEFHSTGIPALFNFFVNADAKKSDLNVGIISQGGLGLPDVEYYTKDDARSKEIRERYVKHVTNMFKLIDVDEETANRYSQIVMDIETKLAKVSNTRLENRDPYKTYNKMTYDNLKSISENIDWDKYFTNLGIDKIDVVVVNQPKFIKGASELIDEISLNDWKIYFKWNVLRSSASALSSPFVNEQFEFEGKFLRGQKVIEPRWKRVIGVLNRTVGELLGQIYVAKVFPPEAKEKAKAIVNNLLVAMEESIKNLDWMSDETKQKALTKLSTFGVKIGYPDKWKDYSELEIARDSYFKNLRRAATWARKENLKKLGKPVDKSEWGMTPQTVNASYSPTKNEITFPAGILQPPFFNPQADDAINYGAMGAVIGHEITHGFDDQGRKYDEKGNIKDWWTKEDNEKFQARAQKLIEHYNNFVVIDTFRVNGALTLGENIADLGGLTISFAAFKKTEQYKKGELIDGFTPAQRFFLGWAQVWATNIRPEALKLQVKTDVHSPSVQRVNGPLMNMPEFFEAFDVKPGDPMRNPEDKIVKIW
ncbi:M13 family metallopeptidase [Rosettibacter firmus]|uniref:M13 family metallopeptidase n=1 Tax=Rosettibacter firmus TaxID=3111522 RepID=UPI00336C2081